MKVSTSPLTGESDLRLMEALARQNHAAFVHTFELPWRFVYRKDY